MKKELKKNNFVVNYKTYSTVISETLLTQRNVSENLELIKNCHLDKFKVFSKMEKTDDSNKLKKCAKQIESIEFKLQGLWGFPLDRNYHKWFNVPKCSCPKIDNLERLGTEYRIFEEGCPVHGE